MVGEKLGRKTVQDYVKIRTFPIHKLTLTHTIVIIRNYLNNKLIKAEKVMKHSYFTLLISLSAGLIIWL